MKIFVGNLAPDVTEEDLKTAFAAFGQVTAADVIKDKFTGVSRGFGFVEMPGKAHSMAAITGLNFQDLKGQQIKVNEARPSPQGGGRRGGRW
jgi:RNA recognition motif-containing protein